MMPRLLPAVAGLALLLTAAPAPGQRVDVPSFVPEQPTHTPMQEKWMVGIKETDQLLRQQRWEAAAKRGRKAGEAIVDLAGTGDSPAYSLAVVDVLRAIAEAEMGNQDEAEWLWDSALNLFPDVAKTDLSPYGAKAVALRQRTLRELGEAKTYSREEIENQAVAQTVERPRIRRQTRPEYPKALALLGEGGVVLVSAIIGEDGRPRQPLILETKTKAAALKYVVLDLVREWRFDPARREGKPVPVGYVLTVGFKQRK